MAVDGVYYCGRCLRGMGVLYYKRVSGKGGHRSVKGGGGVRLQRIIVCHQIVHTSEIKSLWASRLVSRFPQALDASLCTLKCLLLIKNTM